MTDSGKKTKMLSREDCADWDDEMLFADGFDEALIGVTSTPNIRAVYSIEDMIGILMKRDGMTDEEAIEYLEYNTFSAHHGDKTPIYIRTEIS